MSIFDTPANERTWEQLRCFGTVRAGFLTEKDRMWLALFSNPLFKFEDLAVLPPEKLMEIAKKGRDAP